MCYADTMAQGEPRKAVCRYKVTGDSVDHASQLFKSYEVANFYTHRINEFLPSETGR